ncbi:hypothetical protein CAPTEDRAFT_97326 [Capitella teleta]|uniref:BTB domain-containing protein n=1 Tax=Capitella teleta TaxID=283909 RepID=R7TAZ4_CAPTE|nr:hypothetical protein CAPTEDRAFT_97326 [Capitella teleta]|eukprot:ELT90682.1 hypothetical protein CAPTEDRAFT_97326 [Capitella teleta]
MTQAISSLPAAFLQMREAEEFVDITLVFGSQRIACHKVVLAGMCDFFRRMFLTDMLERGSQEIAMKGISASIGLSLVDYMYTGHIGITTQNAQDLLLASEMLLIDNLKQAVEQFLNSHTESTNCVSIINLARIYNMKTLQVDALRYLQEHASDVIDAGEMHLLQEEDLIEVLEANYSQHENFRFIQKWIRSADERIDRFDHLMQHVSLSQCSKDFVCSTIMEEELMLSTQGMKHIQQFLQSYGSADPPEQQSLIVGNMTGDIWLNRNIHIHQWQPIQKPPFQTQNYSACARPGGFVVSGGRSQEHISQRECYSYDAQNGQWSTLSPMSTARRHHSLLYHNHHLYTVGGFDGNHLNSVEALDLRSLHWNQLPPLPLSVASSYLVIVSGNLFVLGGYNGVWLTDVHEFDSKQPAWRHRPPMPEICVRGAAVSSNDHVYVVGGEDRSCMRFNPRNNVWTFLQRPQLNHGYGPSLMWKGNILVFGGHSCESIEEYSPLTDSWSTWTLKTPKEGIGFVARMNCIGEH